jgi:hypothetical protein
LAARGLTTLTEVISSMSGLGDEAPAARSSPGVAADAPADEGELEPARVLSLLS